MGAGDGLLVRDINGDGVINDGRELFGVGTILASGQRAGNGYNAMADLDSNHDGKLSAADAKFTELKLWVDANHDGKTDLGELQGLADFGVASIDLNYALSTASDHGNAHAMVSSWTDSGGAQHDVADVYFAKQAASEAPLTLGDLLAPPAAELLAGASPATSVASTAAGTAASTATTMTVVELTPMHRSLLEDELQKHGPLI